MWNGKRTASEFTQNHTSITQKAGGFSFSFSGGCYNSTRPRPTSFMALTICCLMLDMELRGPHAPTTSPSRLIRYFQKFQVGSEPLFSARKNPAKESSSQRANQTLVSICYTFKQPCRENMSKKVWTPTLSKNFQQTAIKLKMFKLFIIMFKLNNF